MAILGASMLAPAFVDFVLGNPTWPVFLGAALVCITIGLGLWASARGTTSELGARQAILMTVGSYQMVGEDGEVFTVDIPAFSLDLPDARPVLN